MLAGGLVRNKVTSKMGSWPSYSSSVSLAIAPIHLYDKCFTPPITSLHGLQRRPWWCSRLHGPHTNALTRCVCDGMLEEMCATAPGYISSPRENEYEDKAYRMAFSNDKATGRGEDIFSLSSVEMELPCSDTRPSATSKSMRWALVSELL